MQSGNALPSTHFKQLILLHIKQLEEQDIHLVSLKYEAPGHF